MEQLDLLWVCLAAFFAGGLNSLAGGGSFITLPALLSTGVPPVLANTTSAAVLLPGYLGSVVGFKRTYSTLQISKIFSIFFIACIFSIVGATLLVNSSDEFFMKFIPFLIFFATLMFLRKPNTDSNRDAHPKNFLSRVFLAFVSSYGGYFNGGLGIALLSALSLDTRFNLKQMSAIKSLLSFFITLTSVSVFVLNGLIVWSYVLYMIFFSIIGGFLGAKLTESLPTDKIRLFIICIGFLLSFSLFYIEYLG